MTSDLNDSERKYDKLTRTALDGMEWNLCLYDALLSVSKV